MNKITLKKQMKTTDKVIEMRQNNGVYSKKKSFFLKHWWDTYIKRLNKVTSGKPQCCK